MRSKYIVTYDISDDKRLRKIFKKMKTFGLHIQLSVFECELSARELAIMKAALAPLVQNYLDQVLIFDLGPVDGRGKKAIQSIGFPYTPIKREPVVI
ncbi:MAG: CRISPR-associated endonuclease Cas2 [Myxococcota bacterium]|jgi:CRISPR-associated protein Cas2